MAYSDSLSSTFTGVVRSVNEKGLRLDGHDSWFNFSKFAVGIVAPERGQTVSVSVDKAGFVRSVQPLDGPAPIMGGSDVRIDAQTRSGPSDKDRTITRLACLKAAADFASSRHDLKSGEVIRIAESFERWVNRPADSLDLDEAF